MAHVIFNERRVGIFDSDVNRHAGMITYARSLRATEILQHNTTPVSSSLTDDVQLAARLMRAGEFGVIVTSDDDPVAVSALEMLGTVDNPHATVLQQATKPTRGEVLMHVGKTPYRIIPVAAGQLSVATTIL